MALASTILVDLGNDGPDNLLTSPTYLQYYSSNFTAIQSAMIDVLSDDSGYWPRYLPSNQTYDELKDTTGPLGISPSVIYTQYVCQVPKKKTAGSMIVSVFVADVVFLQAVWTLFKFATTSWLERRDPDATKCMGCLELRKQLDQDGTLLQQRNGSFRSESPSKSPLLAQSVEVETLARQRI